MDKIAFDVANVFETRCFGETFAQFNEILCKWG